jgi:hypothetical protein
MKNKPYPLLGVLPQGKFIKNKAYPLVGVLIFLFKIYKG